MMGRDRRTENAVAFAVKEHPATTERPMWRHCGHRGYTEDGCIFALCWQLPNLPRVKQHRT